LATGGCLEKANYFRQRLLNNHDIDKAEGIFITSWTENEEKKKVVTRPPKDWLQPAAIEEETFIGVSERRHQQKFFSVGSVQLFNC
jgi:hypothetical protein